MSTIIDIPGGRIRGSRDNPTVRVDVILDNVAMARAVGSLCWPFNSTQHGTLRCRKREPSTPSMALQWPPPTAKPPKSVSASFAGSLEQMAFACSFMNRFNPLGTVEIVPVA